VKAYDVVIVGGGIIGGSIAFELAQQNLRVAVLDRQELMREASWAAAGMLSPAPDCLAAIPLVPLSRASLSLYPQFVETVEQASGLPTSFRTEGAIEIISRGDAERELSTLVALHRGLGLECEPLPLDEAIKMEPSLGRNTRAAALLPSECSIEPRALSSAVLAALTSMDVDLHPGVAVSSLALDGKRCVGVKSSTGEILPAGHVVIAAGCWTSLISEATAYAPTLPVRGQMIALRHSGTPIGHVLRCESGYLVPRGTQMPQTIVVGSTIENVGYAKGITSGGIEKILSVANELVPELAKAEIIETWSGLRPGSPDQLPILGPAEIGGLLFATGHYRNGILLTAITAKLIREWIIDGKTSFDWEVFSPLRFLRANGDRSARAQ
jgi:glycine oxidase